MIDTPTMLVLTPLVTGLVEAAKRAGLPVKYTGIAAVAFAMGLVALAFDDYTSQEAFYTAIATGLAAAGFYSQVKMINQQASGTPQA